jgi:asparagine synthase (glutamine-hydrolysing)
MCGIAGVVRRNAEVDAKLLYSLVGSMRNRGPDDAGYYREGGVGLGMRRLAILDLEHGDQPFLTPDGEIVAFVNGEIYNFRELQSDLKAWGARFRTSCDAEVIPHGFRRWGAEGLARRLDGMFAIAVYDRSTRMLHLIRDRFGEKPLFYVERADTFAFASQLTSLLLVPGVDLEIHPTALRHYLALHFVPGPRTICRQVRRVPPGHRVVVDVAGSRPVVTRQWSEALPGAGPSRGGYRGAVEEVRERLQHAVRSRLVADVPVGVFLSGGVDSSAIAAAIAHQGIRPRTFSIGFEHAELDESRYARETAAHVGSEHHHFDFDLKACLDVFDEAVEALDEPLGDPACLPVYLLSREARRYVKVVLSGEGGDEFFAGYGYYPPPPYAPRPTANRLASWLRLQSRPAEAATPRVPEPFLRTDNTTLSGFPLLTSAADRDALVREAAEDEDPWLARAAARLATESCALRRAQLADVETWLADDLLPKLDHMTMARSLEGRAPYLEPQLAGLALSLRPGWKIGSGSHKRVLRDAVSPWLPAQIVHRPKQGFVLPMQQWLAGPLRERLLTVSESDQADGLNSQATREIVAAELATGAHRSRLLYALLVYREWFTAVQRKRTLAHRLAEASRGGAELEGSSRPRRVALGRPPE